MNKITIEQSNYPLILELALQSNSKTDLLNNLGHKNRTHQLYKLEALLVDNNFDFNLFPNKNHTSSNSVFNNKELLTIAVKTSNSYAEIIRFFNKSITGANLKTLKKYLSLFNLKDFFLQKGIIKRKIYRRTSEAIFIENSLVPTSTIRYRIIKEQLLKYECSREQCRNNGDWHGDKLVLQLEHKNGNNRDHRLENLEFLCPNCHSITITWGNKKRQNAKTTLPKLIEKKVKNSHKTTITYPPLEELIILVKEKGYSATGREIGCSDNAIRKHLKKQNINI